MIPLLSPPSHSVLHAAFALPMLHTLITPASTLPDNSVLTPTLAITSRATMI